MADAGQLRAAPAVRYCRGRFHLALILMSLGDGKRS